MTDYREILIDDSSIMPPQHMPGPLPGSLGWHEEQLAQLPWWRLLARYQRRQAIELARERCLDMLEQLRERLSSDRSEDT